MSLTWPQFEKKHVRSISSILFEVRIPNLVCGYILGQWSVTHCFPITVTLTSGLSSRNILSFFFFFFFWGGGGGVCYTCYNYWSQPKVQSAD